MATKKFAPKKSAVSTETRDQKFVRLAVKRVNKVINDIRLVGNLASYPHTPEQAASILNALNEAVDTLSVKMAPRVAKGKESFTL